jgi:hypothetical protein
MAETDVQEIVGLDPLELLTTKESDTRPRPQAGAVCVREKTQGQKHEILLRATGRGERGATS